MLTSPYMNNTQKIAKNPYIWYIALGLLAILFFSSIKISMSMNNNNASLNIKNNRNLNTNHNINKMNVTKINSSSNSRVNNLIYKGKGYKTSISNISMSNKSLLNDQENQLYS
jgi:hypothetical protein